MSREEQFTGEGYQYQDDRAYAWALWKERETLLSGLEELREANTRLRKIAAHAPAKVFIAAKESAIEGEATVRKLEAQITELKQREAERLEDARGDAFDRDR